MFGIDVIYLLIVAIVSWSILIVMISGVLYQGLSSNSFKNSFASRGIDINTNVPYKCPNAKNLKSGTDCSFDLEQDAANQCTSNPACIGYVYKNNVYKPTTNISLDFDNGGEYYPQDKFISPLYSNTNNFSKHFNKPKEYTCPKAINQWIDPVTKLIDPNWCRFNNGQDAANWCTTDPTCIGYTQDREKINNVINPIKDNQNITYIAVTKMANNNKDKVISYTKKPLPTN